MHDFRADLRRVRELRDEAQQEGVGSTVGRLARHGLHRLAVEVRLALKEAAPFVLVPTAVIGLIALLAKLPFGAGLVLVGLIMFVGGVAQAFGAFGGIGAGPTAGRNVPRIYEHMDPSWSASDSPEERRSLWQQRREQGVSLFVKLATAAAILIGAGIAITAVVNAMG